MTTEVAEVQGASGQPSDRTSRWRWLIAATMLVVVAAVLVVVTASRGDDSRNVDATLGAQQLASMQQACAPWLDGYPGPTAPPSGWCNETGWMADQVRTRQMMGSMMWNEPDQLLATCQEWMSSNSTPASGSTLDGAGWCGQMVDWMTQRMGDWESWDRGWMMNGASGD